MLCISSLSTGPIGLVSLLVAKAMGASKVVITGNARILRTSISAETARTDSVPSFVLWSTSTAFRSVPGASDNGQRAGCRLPADGEERRRSPAAGQERRGPAGRSASHYYWVHWCWELRSNCHICTSLSSCKISHKGHNVFFSPHLLDSFSYLLHYRLNYLLHLQHVKWAIFLYYCFYLKWKQTTSEIKS